MKKTFFGFLFLLALVNVSSAQEVKTDPQVSVQKHHGKKVHKMPSPDEIAKRESNKLEKVLSLDKATKQKVHDIVLDRAKQMKDLFETAKASGQKVDKEKAKQLADTCNDQIRALLNDSQKPKFDQWLENRKEKMKKRMREKKEKQ